MVRDIRTQIQTNEANMTRYAIKSKEEKRGKNSNEQRIRINTHVRFDHPSALQSERYLWLYCIYTYAAA